MPAVTTLNPQTQQPPLATNKNGQPKTLPYGQDGQLMNVQTAPAPKPAQPQQPATQQSLQQGSNNVMQTAQNMAIQKANQPNQTMNIVEQGAQQLLQNPMGQGYNGQKYIDNQLQQADRTRANAMQAFQQQYADVGNTGANIEKAYNFAMQGAQERTDLQNKLQMQDVEARRKAQIEALNLGGEVAQQSTGLDSEAFDRLLGARSAFEGERAQTSDQAFQKDESALGRAHEILLQSNDIEGQKGIEELKGKIAQGLQVSAQDFEATQSGLDRNLQQALTAQNIDAVRQNLATQLEVDKWKVTQGMEFEGEQSAYARAHELAMQANDIGAAREALQKQIELDRWKAESGYEFTDAQNTLNRALELQLQSNDFDGQSSLMSLKAELDKDSLLTAQDFQASQAALDRQIQESIASGNWANAEKLQNLQNDFEIVKTEKENEYQIARDDAQRNWMSSERVNEQDFTKYMDAIDKQFANAQSDGDFEKQQMLMDQKAQIDLKLQTNGMDHDTAMATLNAQLAEAKANNDVDRQVQIMTFQHTQDMDTMTRQQGWQAAQAELDRNMQEALQRNDINAQKALQKSSYQYSSQLAAGEYEHDIVIRKMEQAFTEKSVAWATIANQMASMDGGQAAAFLKQEGAKYGINVPEIQQSETERKTADTDSGINKIRSGEKLTGYEYNAVLASGQYKTFDQAFPNGVNSWTRDGMNRWALTGEAKGAVGETVIYNGELYRVASVSDVSGRHEKATMVLENVQRGDAITLGG